jgi:hypothetical protein
LWAASNIAACRYFLSAFVSRSTYCSTAVRINEETVSSFFLAIRSSSAKSRSLMRTAVSFPAAPDPKRVGPLVEKLKQIAELSGDMDFSLVEEDYQEYYATAHQRFQSHPLRAFVMPFWRRLRDHVLKLAAVYELSTSGSLKVSRKSMEHAIDTARIIEQNIYELVQSSFSTEGVQSQNLENYVREAGPNGRSQTEVVQFLRGEKRLDALNRIAMLVDAGVVQWFRRKTTGRPAMILVHTSHLDAHAKAHPQDQVYSARSK